MLRRNLKAVEVELLRSREICGKVPGKESQRIVTHKILNGMFLDLKEE
jgi:hypothetical protein